MVTLLLVEGQTPFEIVHCKTDAAPGVSPVTPELKSVGVVTTAVPEVTVHAPVPGAGLLPARVVTRTLQRFWVAPALATGARGVTVTAIVLAVPVPQPLTADTLMIPLVAIALKLTVTELLVPVIVAPVPL